MTLRWIEGFEEALEIYPPDSLVSTHFLLSLLGYSFFWRRKPGEPLSLIGHSSIKDDGLALITKLATPDELIGCGRWNFAVNRATMKDKNADDAEIILSLHLHSNEPDDIHDLLETELEAEFVSAAVLRGKDVA